MALSNNSRKKLNISDALMRQIESEFFLFAIGAIADAGWLMLAEALHFDRYSGRMAILPLLVAAHILRDKENFSFFIVGWYAATILHTQALDKMVSR